MGPSLAGKPIPDVKWDAERDAKIAARVKELLESNAEVKALAEKNPYLAWRKALAIAAKEIPPKGGGFGGGTGDVARSQGDDKIPDKQWDPHLRKGLSRDEAVRELANKFLRRDPECVRLARTDEYKAYKLAIIKAARADYAATEEQPAERSASTAALPRPVLERARLVHKGAMILLKSDPALQELAAKNYPQAFDVAHSQADGTLGEQRLCVPAATETNAIQRGTREDRIYQRALTTLKTALKDRDVYDSLGAFDEAIRDAEVSTPLDGQPVSPITLTMPDPPRRQLKVRFPADPPVLVPGEPRVFDRNGKRLA